VQHLLRSNCDCAEFLLKRGLAKSKLRIFGKAYSTSGVALKYYKDRGFNAKSIGEGYDYSSPFDHGLIVSIREALSSILAQGERNILLIDEGGLALQAAASFTQRDIRFAVAELTARGAHHYNLLQHRAPIIDVARSDAKKRIEAPLIARSMATLLGCRLQELGAGSLSATRVGLVGAGAIGGALASELQAAGAIVSIFDTMDVRATSKGIRELLIDAEVVTSSTGQGMDWSELVTSLRDGTVLANCGSSDIEFQPWRLRARFEPQQAFNVQVPSRPWRGNLSTGTDGHHVTLLGGGFPVNFDGSPDPIPAREIQLTRAILMAGAIQAVTSRNLGIIALDAGLQTQIAVRYNELLAC
jgi:S-adenosylhomocysteine hydrolase